MDMLTPIILGVMEYLGRAGEYMWFVNLNNLIEFEFEPNIPQKSIQ